MAVTMAARRRQKSRVEALDERWVYESQWHLPQPLEVPDIIEFVTSPQYCNKVLYPRQATLLKIIFLQTELFTEYDYQVIAEWTQEFHLPPDEARDAEKPLAYQGDWGIQPDILERIDILKKEGRLWFAEVLAAIGRRGGKGYIGGLCGAYILWHYICRGDPQDHYAIDPTKRLTALVFAGKKDQAKQNQWRDLVEVILNAPCFREHYFYPDLVSRALNEALTIFSPRDHQQSNRNTADSTMDQASFEILPKEATAMAGRGPASFMLYFDEMAHVVATGANRDADEIYDSSTPSLGQFGVDGFVYAGSSTWQMIGKFYELCQQALEVEHDTEEPVYPDKLLIQLTSWDIYRDWDRAHKIPLVPKRYAHRLAKGVPSRIDKSVLRASGFYGEECHRHGRAKFRVKCFRRLKRAPAEYDDQMRRLERANPESFAVERRSKWAAALDTYLKAEFVDRMFMPWPEGRALTMQTAGILKRTYAAHGDPSKSGANFGWAIGHTEGPDEQGLMHVVIDKVHFWAPYHFDDGQVDYIQIGEEIGEDIETFIPDVVTFDQFNSVEIMQRLNKRARNAHLPKRVSISEETATRPKNWIIAETFKTALGMNLIHCFAAETRYMTEDGIKTLGETDGTTQRVLTQTGKWVDAEIRNFGEMPLRRLTLRRQGETKVIYTTDRHRWLVTPLGHRQRIERAREVFTEDLQPDMRLAWMKPRSRLTGVQPSPYGIAHGIVVGDGARAVNGTYVTLWGDKDAQLLRYFPDDCRRSHHTTPAGVKGVRVHGLPNGFKEMPSLDESPAYLYGWLAGYFAADGTVGKKNQAIITSVKRENLEFVRRVCDRLGIAYHSIRSKRLTTEWAASEVCYEMQLLSAHLTEDFFLIAEHRERWSRESRESLAWRVVSVEETDRVEDVYCAVVPDTESFVLEDHILTKNCPYFEQLELEAKFLQDLGGRVDHPTMGPVQTKDVWDAVANVVYHLIGDQMTAFMAGEFRAAGIQGSGGVAWPDELSAPTEDRETFDALSSFARRRVAAETARLPNTVGRRRRR